MHVDNPNYTHIHAFLRPSLQHFARAQEYRSILRVSVMWVRLSVTWQLISCGLCSGCVGSLAFSLCGLGYLHLVRRFERFQLRDCVSRSVQFDVAILEQSSLCKLLLRINVLSS